MKIILLEFVIIIILFDLTLLFAKLEMYKDLKNLNSSGIKEIPLSTYSSVCFYLIPSDNLIKIPNLLPINQIFNRKIKSLIKDMTYDGENIIERLNRIKELEKLPISELKKLKITIKS